MAKKTTNLRQRLAKSAAVLITNFADRFDAFVSDRLEQALKFAKAFADWKGTFPADAEKSETSLSSFLRQAFPDLPKDREGYRKDKRFAAAQNLIRTARQHELAEAEAAKDAGTATAEQLQMLAERESRRNRRTAKDDDTATTPDNGGIVVTTQMLMHLFLKLDVEANELPVYLEAAGFDKRSVMFLASDYKAFLTRQAVAA